MTELLAGDHAEVDALFRDLSRGFERGDARAVFERLDYLWARLAVHIRAEHLHLFPALLAASAARRGRGAGDAPAPEEVRAAVERLREDHDFFMRELAEAVSTARELAAQEGTPDSERLMHLRGQTFAVAERLVGHNRLEEGQVYLWPAALLSAAELNALGAVMKREIENLPPRFAGRAQG